MLININIVCLSRVYEIIRDNGGFLCLFVCFCEVEGGGGIDWLMVYCNFDNEKIWIILIVKVFDFFIIF